MSAWLPTAPCTPGACVKATGSAAAVPRAVLRLTAVLALLLAGVALSPLGRRVPADWIRRWCQAIVRAAGVRVRVTGPAAPTGGLLLVAHHVSWLDIPLLAAVRPARMLAKTEIRRWPVAGALVARGGALFIERDRLRALPDTVARIAAALRGGSAVAAFPEGSTWCGRARGRFHRAVFQAALDARVPVQPVRIRYLEAGGEASTAPAFVGDDTLLASVWRVLSARGLTAEVEIRPVVPPGAHPDRRTLARAAEPDDGAGACAGLGGAAGTPTAGEPGVMSDCPAPRTGPDEQSRFWTDERSRFRPRPGTRRGPSAPSQRRPAAPPPVPSPSPPPSSARAR
ncbi:lysophospholipid acyltransferase family protein [Streptomyces sp. NPDC007070]|uniref:lysophospholipid acyltransferase family protein n=1 Tax=Streptomyces sp. NPDC007070 TaxID=3154312 RepID=UPI0033E44E02